MSSSSRAVACSPFPSALPSEEAGRRVAKHDLGGTDTLSVGAQMASDRAGDRVSAGPFSRGLAWPALIFIVGYIAIFTQDLRLGAVPLKVPLVVTALAIWWWERGRHAALADFRAARPVLALGVAAPLIWSLVAVVTRAIGSDVALIAYGDIAEAASRFGYVLLYFPLADLLGDARSPRHRAWLWPVLVLAVVTWLLWAGMAVVDAGYRDRSTVLAFSGIFGEQGGAFRVFVANQILFVPALGLLLARALAVRWSWTTLGALALLLSASYHAHTRGLWIALLATGVVVLLLGWTGLMRYLLRLSTARYMKWALPGLLVVIVGVATAVLLGVGVDRIGFFGDQSVAARVSQAGILVDGWRNQPVLGSGLGASLRGGYVRSIADPWSFELTYLQVLFQMGVVGLAILLWALMALWPETVQALGRRAGGDGRRVLSMAGLATLTGVAVASTTNPYLLSAFGMLCVAIGLALTDLGLRAPDKPVAGPALARPPGLPVVLVVVVAMIVLCVLEFAGERV